MDCVRIRRRNDHRNRADRVGHVRRADVQCELRRSRSGGYSSVRTTRSRARSTIPIRPVHASGRQLDLAAERGPAVSDARHRFMSLANFPLPRKFRMATSVRIQSALPYNVTTGQDDNGDTVSNDRPAGMTRNSGRGSAPVDLGARLSWTVGVRRAPAGRVRRPAGPHRPRRRRRSAEQHGRQPMASNKRYTIELYAQAYNLTNHVNAQLQRRADVTFLWPADIGGRAASTRDSERDSPFSSHQPPDTSHQPRATVSRPINASRFRPV